jgi:hypothetical protein
VMSRRLKRMAVGWQGMVRGGLLGTVELRLVVCRQLSYNMIQTLGPAAATTYRDNTEA